MFATLKSALTVVSEALETAATCALLSVGIYAAIFVDLTGNGSLREALRHIQAASQEELKSPNATRVIMVPVQAVVEKSHEDRILAVFDDEPAAGMVVAVYEAPEAAGQRPGAAFTDTPANFTVYGDGDHTTSARPGVGSRLSQGALAAVDVWLNVR